MCKIVNGDFSQILIFNKLAFFDFYFRVVTNKTIWKSVNFAATSKICLTRIFSTKHDCFSFQVTLFITSNNQKRLFQN